MRKGKKRFWALMVMLSLTVASVMPVAANEYVAQPAKEHQAQPVNDIVVTSIEKYGNLVLEITGTELFEKGYTYGDMITANIWGTELDMPIGANYSDVDEGSAVCRVVIAPEEGKDAVVLAINMGNLATATNVAIKTKIEEDPGYRWDYIKRIALPVRVSISMKEKGGYYDEYMIRQLKRTNDRADYPLLNDFEFANFRPVMAGNMEEGILFRSSSPINDEIGRNTYADAGVGVAGIKTVVNLADTHTVMESYAGWKGSKYAACNIIPLNLGVDFSAPEFKAGLAEGLRFLAKEDGPYLVHCTEGKDRAGFVSALLECLAGASAEEVVADYMVTYYNYYGVMPGSAQYEKIGESNIKKTLETAFAIEDIDAKDLDLCKEAVEYMMTDLGMSEGEVAVLWDKLTAIP